ncbi:MAG: hypothetical protein ACRECV_15710 [Xanthobacteraceae bacterium]
MAKFLIPPRDQFGMLDKIGGVADHAGDAELAVGQFHVPPERPLMLVSHIAGLEAVSLRAH